MDQVKKTENPFSIQDDEKTIKNGNNKALSKARLTRKREVWKNDLDLIHPNHLKIPKKFWWSLVSYFGFKDLRLGSTEKDRRGIRNTKFFSDQ